VVPIRVTDVNSPKGDHVDFGRAGKDVCSENR